MNKHFVILLAEKRLIVWVIITGCPLFWKCGYCEYGCIWRVRCSQSRLLQDAWYSFIFGMFDTSLYLSNKLITNCCSGFLFTTDLKKFYRKKHSCCRSFRKYVVFKVSYKLSGAGARAAIRIYGSTEPEQLFRLHNTDIFNFFLVFLPSS